MTEVFRLLKQHPHWAAAFQVAERLKQAGHRVLFAGGCVRDALRGVLAQDLDLATSATPDQVLGLFDKTVEVGKSFGVVRVLEGGADLEVATFRKDCEYADGRRPQNVAFCGETEDALRRDFTVNALFYDPFADEVKDHVHGLVDLQAKILRTVGDPEKRFFEDRLRLFRAVRFAVQLGFSLEEKTWNAVKGFADDIQAVSRERVRDELLKLLKAGPGLRGLKLLRESGLLLAAFPQLKGFESEMEADADLFVSRKQSSGVEALQAWLAPLAIAKAAEFSSRIEPLLESLKLAKKDEKAVLSCWRLMATFEEFWKKSEGERIHLYDEPAVRRAFDLWEMKKGESMRVRELAASWRKILTSEGRLPAPQLSGTDVKDQVQGPRLGLLLGEAYHAQLEGCFHDKNGALAWVAAWLKR